MMSIEEKYYNVGNAKLPWISFGTGASKNTQDPLLGLLSIICLIL